MTTHHLPFWMWENKMLNQCFTLNLIHLWPYLGIWKWMYIIDKIYIAFTCIYLLITMCVCVWKCACRSLSVLFFYVGHRMSVLQYTGSDFPFGIFKLVFKVVPYTSGKIWCARLIFLFFWQCVWIYPL
jgi:hypothetical protein